VEIKKKKAFAFRTAFKGSGAKDKKIQDE